MPLAWRGLAGCLVRRPVAVVCVYSACGGGRIATRELACGERTGEKGQSCQRAFHSYSFTDPSSEKTWNVTPGFTADGGETKIRRVSAAPERCHRKISSSSETTALFLERAAIPTTDASPSGGGSTVWLGYFCLVHDIQGDFGEPNKPA